MARRTVIVRTVPGPGDTRGPREIGKIIDTGDGQFIATTGEVEGMVRDEKGFKRYWMGYSSGYTEYLPEVAVRKPQQWRQLTERVGARRYRTPEELEAAFDSAYAEIFG